jgi:hypothetical protein
MAGVTEFEYRCGRGLPAVALIVSGVTLPADNLKVVPMNCIPTTRKKLVRRARIFGPVSLWKSPHSNSPARKPMGRSG